MDEWTEEDKERANQALADAVLEVKRLRKENERMRAALKHLIKNADSENVRAIAQAAIYGQV